MLTEFKHHLNGYLAPNAETSSLREIVEFNKKHPAPYPQEILEDVEQTAGAITSPTHLANKDAITAVLRGRLEQFMTDNGLDAILVSSSPFDFGIALPAFAGFPAISVPAGRDAKSTPQGTTLYTKKGQECTILSLARMLESEEKLKRTSPSFLFSPEPTPITEV